MDDKSHHAHPSSKPPSSSAHHPPTPVRKHDQVAGAAYVAPHHASTTSVHGTHYKAGSTASHPILFPANGTASSTIATISPYPSIAKLPKSTTPLQSTQQLDQSAATTAAAIDQNSHNNNAAGILGPVLGAVAGLIVLGSAFLWFFLRRRKQNQRLHRLDSSPSSTGNDFNHPGSTMERGVNRVMMLAGHGNNGASPASPPSVNYSRTSLHQPAMSRDAKRLTADTLISTDRRSSLSTMVSKKQYMPQLAYSPHGIDKNDLLCISPSNTLIDGFSLAAEEDEKKPQQQQRVPSYQPQIVMDADSEMQSYYEYLSSNSSNDGRSMNNQQSQQPHGEGRQ